MYIYFPWERHRPVSKNLWYPVIFTINIQSMMLLCYYYLIWFIQGKCIDLSIDTYVKLCFIATVLKKKKNVPVHIFANMLLFHNQSNKSMCSTGCNFSSGLDDFLLLLLFMLPIRNTLYDSLSVHQDNQCHKCHCVKTQCHKSPAVFHDPL